mgnify:CR=1 FL=1
MGFFSNLFGKNNEPKDDHKERKNVVDSKKLAAEAQDFLTKIEKHKRVAYIPNTEVVDRSFSTTSKFGGYPYLRDETDWPVCPNCKKNMQLFLQLNLDELPHKKENGLVQVFYCTSYEPEHCEIDLEAYLPFSKSVCCRKIEIGKPSSLIKPTIDEVYEEKEITGWTAKDDYPINEEWDSLGFDYEISEELFDYLDEHEIGQTIQGDKLFGWPFWVQGEEYPNDRRTNAQMELFFQIDSEVNIPYMFGDSGIAHLTQSPDNPSELAFAWACY